jgi:DMSO/TMAO reductase YedYZ molybdopterin-dependent catalytic subunit
VANRGIGITNVRAVLIALLALGMAIGTTSVPRSGATAAQATPAASPETIADGIIEITGLVDNPGPISVADLEQLPRETVEVTYESGGEPEDHTFTGIRLFAVLEHVGIATDPATRNPLLRYYLVITANDGYQVVLSGGEIDPNFGNVPMLLAWEQDGQPIVGDDGPLRLVVPGDLRGGRYVHGIVSIDVRSIKGDAS